MKKLKHSLIGLLAVQCLLVGALFYSHDANHAYDGQQALLAIENTQPDRLVIQEGDARLSLVQADEKWLIDGDERLPTLETKVQGVIDKLQSLKAAWPVATTASSHERFELTEDKHQRRVQFYQGDQLLGDLILGTSPGFRKVHARLADDNKVYAVGLNVYDLPRDKNAWLDKSLLAVTEPKVIELENLKLAKQDKDWALVDTELEPEKELDTEKVRSLASRINQLKVSGVEDKTIDAISEGAEKVVLQVMAGEGEKRRFDYTFFKNNDQYYVHRNDRDTVFSISKGDYEVLAKPELENFLVAKATTKASEEEADSDLANSEERSEERAEGQVEELADNAEESKSQIDS